MDEAGNKAGPLRRQSQIPRPSLHTLSTKDTTQPPPPNSSQPPKPSSSPGSRKPSPSPWPQPTLNAAGFLNLPPSARCTLCIQKCCPHCTGVSSPLEKQQLSHRVLSPAFEPQSRYCGSLLGSGEQTEMHMALDKACSSPFLLQFPQRVERSLAR